MTDHPRRTPAKAPIRRPAAGSAKSRFSEYYQIFRNVRNNLLRLYRAQTWQLSHLPLFPAVFVYYELLLRLYGGSAFFQSLIYPILFAVSLGLFCTCLTSWFRPKVNRILSLVLLYGAGLLFIVECLIRDSYQVYMTPSAISSGAGGVVGGFGGELLRSIIFGIPKIVLFLLPALLYTLTGRRRMPAKRFHRPFIGILLACALVVSGVSTLAATHGKHSAQYEGQFDFNTATKTFGLFTSVRLSEKYALLGGGTSKEFVLEVEPSASPSPSPSAVVSQAPIVYEDNVMDLDFAALAESTDNEELAELHTYVDSLTPSKQNAYTGLFEGKNLILICAEAFSDCVINEELTPTLYRMAHNGFYFSEYYQPTWGGSTSSGEFSFLMGLAPLDGIESILETQYNNNYFTLGNQLQRQNYYSQCYHSGTYDFYDRDLTHENLGYADYLGMGNGIEDLVGSDTSDTTLFDVTMDTYLDKQPFSIYYMTLSGHCIYMEDSPYVTKYLSRVQSVLGSRYKDTTLYYFCYQMELENALTTMIEKLEEAGIADDTVICLTSDHYPYGLENTATFDNTEDYVTDLYGYTYEHSWEQDHNALLIWSGCLETEYQDMVCEISAPTYSLDVVPTLSNLFGLEYDSRLLVGRDVFSDAEPLALWNNYSWVTERGKYDAQEGTFYPNEGYETDEEYVSRINQIVSNKLSFSGQVLALDYYGVLFGEDDITDNESWIPKATAAATVTASPSPSVSPSPSPSPTS